jgi:UrcA family protein
MFKHPFAILFAGVVGVGGLVVGSPAAAWPHPGPNTISVVVTSEGLNLGDLGGARTMLHRIRQAADKVCAFEEKDDFGGCVRSKVDDAVARLNSPMVSAINGGGQGARP